MYTHRLRLPSKYKLCEQKRKMCGNFAILRNPYSLAAQLSCSNLPLKDLLWPFQFLIAINITVITKFPPPEATSGQCGSFYGLDRQAATKHAETFYNCDMCSTRLKDKSLMVPMGDVSNCKVPVGLM